MHMGLEGAPDQPHAAPARAPGHATSRAYAPDVQRLGRDGLAVGPVPGERPG